MNESERRRQAGLAVCALVLSLAAACQRGEQAAGRESAAGAVSTTPQRDPACAADNGGITLPEGFCASVFADSLGHARHIAVAPNGDVYVALEYNPAADSTASVGAVDAAAVALRDVNHDGRADSVVYIGRGVHGGTGVAVTDSFVYVDQRTTTARYPRRQGELAPSGAAQTVISGIPISGDHNARNFILDGKGSLFLNVGSATNSCQRRNRTLESPGRNPCTELRTRAGIWRLDANRTGQAFTPAARFATGIRNAEGLAIDPATGQLFAMQHGRDQLGDNWPELFDQQYSAENPAEELLQVNQGDDFGWPYCYYSVAEQKLVLAPEYGGDGKKTEQCDQKKGPVAVFPAHWAPMDLLFYTGTMLPEKYRHGVFIPFHGSWNRAPLPQAGFQVVFQPLNGARASGAYETFADGFAGGNLSPDQAAHRPVGIAQGPSGELYVSDDVRGRVWRIVYRK